MKFKRVNMKDSVQIKTTRNKQYTIFCSRRNHKPVE